MRISFAVPALALLSAVSVNGCATVDKMFGTREPAGGGRDAALSGDDPQGEAVADEAQTDLEHPFDISAEDFEQDDLAGLAADDAEGPPLQFGLLHAHTMISDGSGTPADAYAAAIDRGLDFFAVTPHNHGAAENSAKSRKDGVLIATNPALYAGASDVAVTRQWRDDDGDHEETLVIAPLKRAADDATDDDFVALYGQEFSTISAGNHVNVFGVDEVLTIENGDFRAFYGLLEDIGEDRVFAQMNHPSVAKDLFNNSTETTQKENDYGFDDFGKNFSKLVDRADRFLVVIEILSGPALVDERYESPFVYSRQHENDYYYYLVQGFHVSPSAGHDNHWLRWGDKTPARMGVYSEKSRDDLIAAIRANRTYATEDTDLRVTFRCNGAFMGSVLDLEAGADIRCEASVLDPTDADALYEAELVYGDVEPQRAGALQQWTADSGWTEIAGRAGDGALTFSSYEASGAPEFFYVRIRQNDGERAWSAPVWVNHPRKYDVE